MATQEEASNIVYQEDIEQAFDTSVEILGPVGRFDPDTSPTLSNVLVMSQKHGPLWYGDISSEESVIKLAEALQTTIALENR